MLYIFCFPPIPFVSSLPLTLYPLTTEAYIRQEARSQQPAHQPKKEGAIGIIHEGDARAVGVNVFGDGDTGGGRAGGGKRKEVKEQLSGDQFWNETFQIK